MATTRTTQQTVTLSTSLGPITITLDGDKAPVTVANFLSYVNSSFYSGTIFHRVIPGFMIQGGGFTASMAQKQTLAAITSEASNGLSNLRGTLAMARTSDPNSATAQFFINLEDNTRLDYSNSNDGYTVFGRVSSGMEIVDRIAEVTTGNVVGYSDVPLQPVMIASANPVLDLAAADDSGSSSQDNITRQTSSLTISGSGQKGTTLTLFDDVNNNGVVDSSEALATVAVTGSSWSKDIALKAGSHAIRSIVSGSSGSASMPLIITIDTTAPAAPSLPDLDSADDDGSSYKDNITSKKTGLNFSGLADFGAPVTLFVDKNGNGKFESSDKTLTTLPVNAPSGVGQWRSADLALAIGSYSIRSVQTDMAGNVSAASSPLNLSIVSGPKRADLPLLSFAG
ncbi:MAG: peptidyl-prolyl cis-trans isomerase [Magnetococcales bacterium]|nr:peptidyl-prolyl cis-trans isomerase [Magnetococcales bacterium]